MSLPWLEKLENYTPNRLMLGNINSNVDLTRLKGPVPSMTCLAGFGCKNLHFTFYSEIYINLLLMDFGVLHFYIVGEDWLVRSAPALCLASWHAMCTVYQQATVGTTRHVQVLTCTNSQRMSVRAVTLRTIVIGPICWILVVDVACCPTLETHGPRLRPVYGLWARKRGPVFWSPYSYWDYGPRILKPVFLLRLRGPYSY